MSKISEKHKLFCKALLKHKFNQTKAYQEVYPSATIKTAESKSSLLVRNDKVIAYLEALNEKQDKRDLTSIEEVIGNIKIALENDMLPDDKGNINTNGVYKGSELLGKYLAMWTDKQVISGTGDGGSIKVEFVD